MSNEPTRRTSSWSPDADWAKGLHEVARRVTQPIEGSRGELETPGRAGRVARLDGEVLDVGGRPYRRFIRFRV